MAVYKSRNIYIFIRSRSEDAHTFLFPSLVLAEKMTVLLTALSVFFNMQLVKVRPSKFTRVPNELHKICDSTYFHLRNSERNELLSLNAELQVPHIGSGANLLKVMRVSTAVQCRHLHAVHKHCVFCAPRVNGMVCLPPPVTTAREK